LFLFGLIKETGVLVMNFNTPVAADLKLSFKPAMQQISQHTVSQSVRFGVAQPTASPGLDQIEGALFALACGDALGCNLETLTQEQIRERVGRQTEIVGGRTRNDFYDWPKGAVTDDTEMTLVMAESLIAKPQWDVWDCLQRFVRWFQGNPQGLGKTTIVALKKAATLIPEYGNRDTDDFAAGAKLSWETLRAAGNGSVMRCSPLGMVFSKQPEKLKQASLESCRITHEAPVCQATTLAYTRIMAAVMNQQVQNNQEFTQLLNKTADEVTSIDAETAAVLRRIPTQTIDRLNPKGSSLNAMEVSLWAFYHLDNLEEALITLVNLGGDTDTNAAVTGALFGAQYGLNAVPERWRSVLLDKEKLSSTARQLLNTKTQLDAVTN
jgi:ADP-ribosyl-[dinitrogen reductase] hydrolase